jgi:ribosomal protein S18 acetylase RimI-like enzyme
MPNIKDIQIVPARSEHFKVVARLHASSITEGFLSTLGTRFLTVLYSGIAQADGSGVLVAVEQDKVLGYISYTRDIKTCYRQVLMSEWPALTLTMVPNAFNLSIYKKAIETLLYPFKHHDNSSGSAVSGAELLSMAVNENARGKGIGKLLVSALDKEMSRMNIDGYHVVTHGIDERSNAFYMACGFTKVSEFLNHGKPMRKWERKVGREI